MGMVRDVLNRRSACSSSSRWNTRHGFGESDGRLLNHICVSCSFFNTPQDAPFFGKLLQREIIYRLLQGAQGDRLRSVATLADQSYRTGKAVSWLRENFKKTLDVDELASLAGMSRSTLHHHFRGLTAMSPLQFQKQLRLHTARQKMLTEELDAASAAFEVSYESPTSSIGSTSDSSETHRYGIFRHSARLCDGEIVPAVFDLILAVPNSAARKLFTRFVYRKSPEVGLWEVITIAPA